MNYLAQTKAIAFTTLFLISNYLTFSQCSSGSVFSDDYSSSANWIQLGAYGVGVYNVGIQPPAPTNGQLLFDQGQLVYDDLQARQDYRFIRPLNNAIANNFVWRSEFEFTIESSNEDISAILLSVTENDQHPEYIDGVNVIPTNNSGLTVYLTNEFKTKQGYVISAFGKKGTITGIHATAISLSPQVLYYARLDRFDASTARLSVFSDAARTIHIPGSPSCFPIHSEIDDLNYVQHATSTGASSTRRLSAKLDNLCIYDSLIDTVCSVPCVTAKLSYETVEEECNVISFTDLSWSSLTGTVMAGHIAFGDGTSATLTGNSITHVYPTTGTYTACLTVFGLDDQGNCCSDQICIQVGCGDPESSNRNKTETGINNEQKPYQLQLYPNPAEETLYIIGTSPLKQIQVFDINGALVLEKMNIEQSTYKLNTSDFSAGLYLIKSNHAGSIIDLKFIKR